MISLKWMKSLTNFYWLETNLCQNRIWNSQDLLLVLVDHLLNIVKELENLEKFRNLKYLYRNELEKTWFTHDAAYSDSKHLGKRTIARGGSRNFQKGGGELYVRHHGWLTKKILGFRWSKKAKITLKNVFGEIFLSVFLNCLYFYILWKPCRWNLINFSKFTNTLVRKEKKQPYRSQREKKNWVKLDFAL